MSNGPNIHSSLARFNDVASTLFQEAYNAFRSDVEKLARNDNENVFQLLRSKHSQRFRQLLQQRADSMIDRCNNEEAGHLRAHFGESIRYYEAEFMRKADEY